jgi:UDP-N-acetylmuramate--alanine ligase
MKHAEIDAVAPKHEILRLGDPAYSTTIKAAHRYEVVEVMSRLRIAGTQFHFIGIGGVGMSGLARFLIQKKALVSGSDQSDGAVTHLLRAMGAKIHLGHSADNLDPATEVVVVSAAIGQSNPELQRARRSGCRVYKYAQLLGELMSHFEGIAIAGTHGKSTTSGWLAYALNQIGMGANFVVGAEITQLSASAGSADSGFFVAEACEYDRSFLNIKPNVACVLNIERDHLDCYRDEADIVDAFFQFVLGVKPEGLVIANGQDPNVAEVIERLDGRRMVKTFGFNEPCDYYANDIEDYPEGCRFEVIANGEPLGPTEIVLPGRHNVLNALAVIATAVGIGVEPERILPVMNRFTGMNRRLMLKACVNEVTIIDDYAHHPTEIKASLSAIRQRYQPNKLWCVYQAHQYSRTQALLDEFATSFGQADVVILPDIYFVRDSLSSREQVSAAVLAQRIAAQGVDARYVGTFDVACDSLGKEVRAGDVVVTMGAGDVWKVADEYIQRLRGDR